MIGMTTPGAEKHVSDRLRFAPRKGRNYAAAELFSDRRDPGGAEEFAVEVRRKHPRTVKPSEDD